MFKKTRTLLNELDCQACGRMLEISTKGICAPSCDSEYRLDDEIQVELSEAESEINRLRVEVERLKPYAEIGQKIEWAKENKMPFVGGKIALFDSDFKRLDEMYETVKRIKMEDSHA